MTYSDFREQAAGALNEMECIDYQLGSVRDDFDFGHLVMIRACDFLSVADEFKSLTSCEFASWYQMRLFLSLKALPFHINEFLYSFFPIAEELAVRLCQPTQPQCSGRIRASLHRLSPSSWRMDQP